MGARRVNHVLAVLLGVPVGVGLFTLHYAGGTSYLSNDPQACANCHIMQSQFDSWQKASHHGVANCVDCHLPDTFLEKYVAKAVNGFHHSKAFTFQDFHEPIRITARNGEILQENCLRCHRDLLHPSAEEAFRADAGLGCVHCHRSVGHGPSLGLGGADRGQAAEEESR